MEDLAIKDVSAAEEAASGAAYESPTAPGPQDAEGCVTGEKETIDYNAEYRRERALGFALQALPHLSGGYDYKPADLVALAKALESFVKGETEVEPAPAAEDTAAPKPEPEEETKEEITEQQLAA